MTYSGLKIKVSNEVEKMSDVSLKLSAKDIYEKLNEKINDYKAKVEVINND